MKASLYLFIFLVTSSGCQAPRPKDLGVVESEGKQTFRKCPESPNCQVSHFEGDKDHHMPPIKYKSSKEEAKNLLLEVLKRDGNAKIVTNEENYLHLEYTSSVFKFIDDVEFHFYEPGLIHFRSASRTGHSDLGVNKKRMSQISFYFYQNNM